MFPLDSIDKNRRHDSSIKEYSLPGQFTDNKPNYPGSQDLHDGFEQDTNEVPRNHEPAYPSFQPQNIIFKPNLPIGKQKAEQKLTSETQTASDTNEERLEFPSPFAHSFYKKQHFKILSAKSNEEIVRKTNPFFRHRQYKVSTFVDGTEKGIPKSDMEGVENGQKHTVEDSLALSQADHLVRNPRETLIDYDPQSFNSWQTLQAKDELGDIYFQSDKVEECIDKNCGNPLNSMSAKAYQSANSRLDNSITKSESGIFNSPLGSLVDPKQLGPGTLKADRNRNNKMPIDSSSTGERGKLQEQKQDVRSRLATREIKGRISVLAKFNEKLPASIAKPA